MSAQQTKSLKSSNLLTGKTFEKKEHQLIYRAFLNTLKNPKERPQQWIEKIEEIWELNEEKLSEKEKQELYCEWQSLKKLLNQLEDEKRVFTFVFENSGKIFNDINPKIKSLSEENFCQFLLSVFKKVRKKDLASKENLENNTIGEVVTECLDDIRGTEAKESLIKSVGWPLGIEVDPKNFSDSFKDELLRKVPFLGKDEKEKDERPLSDEARVTKFLGKVFLPLFFSIASILVSGPTKITIVVAVIGAIFAVKGGMEVLFSNDKPGTLYNPEYKKKTKEWGNEIIHHIRDILKDQKANEKSEQPSEIISPHGQEKTNWSERIEAVSSKQTTGFGI